MYQFNIEDDDALSDEQINKHKDFKKVMLRFRQQKPFAKRLIYKDKRFWLWILLIALLGYLVFEAIEEEENNAPSKQEQKK